MIDACKDIETLTIDSYCMYIYQVRCTYAYVYIHTYSVLHNPPSLTGLYRNVCSTCIIVHLLYAQLYTVTVHSMKCTIVTSVSLQTSHTHVRTYICTCLQYTLLWSLQLLFLCILSCGKHYPRAPMHLDASITCMWWSSGSCALRCVFSY